MVNGEQSLSDQGRLGGLAPACRRSTTPEPYGPVTDSASVVSRPAFLPSRRHTEASGAAKSDPEAIRTVSEALSAWAQGVGDNRATSSRVGEPGEPPSPRQLPPQMTGEAGADPQVPG